MPLIAELSSSTLGDLREGGRFSKFPATGEFGKADP
jgi:hypothetical protein